MAINVSMPIGRVGKALGYTGFFIYAAATGIPSIVLAVIVVRKSARRRP